MRDSIESLHNFAAVFVHTIASLVRFLLELPSSFFLSAIRHGGWREKELSHIKHTVQYNIERGRKRGKRSYAQFFLLLLGVGLSLTASHGMFVIIRLPISGDWRNIFGLC